MSMMRENDSSKENFHGDSDSPGVLSVQFDPAQKRMVVRPRTDRLATKEIAPQFTLAADEAVDLRQPDVLVFDLYGQRSVSSGVLSAFVKYHRRGIEVHLLDPSEYILEGLTHTRLLQFFRVHHRSGD